MTTQRTTASAHAGTPSTCHLKAHLKARATTLSGEEDEEATNHGGGRGARAGHSVPTLRADDVRRHSGSNLPIPLLFVSRSRPRDRASRSCNPARQNIMVHHVVENDARLEGVAPSSAEKLSPPAGRMPRSRAQDLHPTNPGSRTPETSRCPPPSCHRALVHRGLPSSRGTKGLLLHIVGVPTKSWVARGPGTNQNPRVRAFPSMRSLSRRRINARGCSFVGSRRAFTAVKAYGS